jgi:hypothetical protein
MPNNVLPNGRSKKDGRHVRLYHWIMRTDAWKSLSPLASAIYPEIASRYMGSNNGRIPYAVRDAVQRFRVGRTAAVNALDMLQERGFIVLVTDSNFTCKVRRAREWRLTEFGCDVTNALASRDFTKWSPKIQNTGSVARPTGSVARPNGSCGVTVPFREAA